MDKVFIIPDCHHPYVDKTAWELVLKVAKAWKPKHLILLGDFCDFYAVSAHDKDPRRSKMLDYEVMKCKEALSQLDALKIKNKVFIGGNHENRLERYLMQKAPELFNMVRVEKILDLKKRGWQYVEYKRFYKLGKVVFTHDLGYAGRYAAHRALDAAQHSCVTGHTHRISYAVEGDVSGVSKLGTSLGWLGSADEADYMHRLRANRDWSLGFGVGYLRPCGRMHLTPVPILVNGTYTCVVDGTLYEQKAAGKEVRKVLAPTSKRLARKASSR
jgi:predicted phosphodiesterase